MDEAFKVFILSTLIITLWTVFLLLQDKRSNTLLNRWFAGFLLTLTVPEACVYTEYLVPGGIPALEIFTSTILWVKGPFMWIFIRILNRHEASLQKVWIHFVPWFITTAVLMVFPNMLLACMVMGMSHMLIYLLFSLRQVVINKHYISDVCQGFQNTAYYWLLYIIAGLMFLIAMDLIVLFLQIFNIYRDMNDFNNYSFAAFSVYVLSIAVLSVYRPELLFRVTSKSSANATPILGVKIEPASELTDFNDYLAPASDQKKRYLELDPALAQSLIQQLTELMQEQQVYRQNALSLPNLASSLGVTVHQLSELLNVHHGESFYEYINGFRLKYACNLLSNPNCQLRILDIAFESGFNNKDSFYRAFKEGLSVTPNQYRLDLRELKTV